MAVAPRRVVVGSRWAGFALTVDEQRLRLLAVVGRSCSREAAHSRVSGGFQLVKRSRPSRGGGAAQRDSGWPRVDARGPYRQPPLDLRPWSYEHGLQAHAHALLLDALVHPVRSR